MVRTTKSERDPYRYVDPNTILVGDPNQTNAVMRRLFSQDPAERGNVGVSLPPSGWWRIQRRCGRGVQLPGMTKVTVGLSMEDGLTMEAWLDYKVRIRGESLTARLQKNPHEASVFGQMGGAIIEQRGDKCRVYASGEEVSL